MPCAKAFGAIRWLIHVRSTMQMLISEITWRRLFGITKELRNL
jgi:hypothetical protein